MNRRVQIVVALAAVGGMAVSACRNHDPVSQPPQGPSKLTPAPSGPGQGVLHDDGTAFFVAPGADPACGTEACGNERLDSCTVWSPDVKWKSLTWVAETCDGPAAPVTCAALGFLGGDLMCTRTCAWDLSRCEICSAGKCTVRPTGLADAPAVVLGMAAATDGERVRLSWSVADPTDARPTACLYAGWADTADVQLLDCGTIPSQPVALALQSSGEGVFELDVEYGSRAWRGQIDASGRLLAELVPRTVQTPDPGKGRCETIAVDDDPDGLRLQRHDAAAEGGSPVMVQWTRAGHSVGAPFRLLTAPYADACIGGAALGEQLTVALHVPSHGLVTTTIPLP